MADKVETSTKAQPGMDCTHCVDLASATCASATSFRVARNPQEHLSGCNAHAADPSTTAIVYRGRLAALRVRAECWLGRGASATVYLAELEQGTFCERVAVKVYHAPDTMMQRELSMWRTLEHRNIQPFYGICRLGFNQFGLVSPCVANGNMMNYLENHPDAPRLDLVRDVAEGLRYLHEDVGIVHGDIKGENVLVSYDGTAMLADFGLSTTIDAGAHTTATEICNRMTLQFAAPELILDIPSETDGRRSKTRYSDIYAFGMLVYQVFTGRLPWAGLNALQICLALTEGRLPHRVRLHGDGENARGAVWAVCRLCWQRAPGARPRAAHLARKFERLADAGASRSAISSVTRGCIMMPGHQMHSGGPGAVSPRHENEKPPSHAARGLRAAYARFERRRTALAELRWKAERDMRSETAAPPL